MLTDLNVQNSSRSGMDVQHPILTISGISKEYGKNKVVDNLNLVIQKGEVFTFLGPSGCGKTTTLRMIAGLETPTAGEIRYQDRLFFSSDEKVFVPPAKRNLGMVFQSYAIWPHMTVYENVCYPLKLRRVRNGVAEKVMEALSLVGLSEYADRPATKLSGGQKQRVALARSLVYEPYLLLLDEPFSNLDAKLRTQMRIEIKELQRTLGITVLFVTHDQIEAMSLSDRIAVMNDGRIEQIGRPLDLYDRPCNPFVRDFLGSNVLIKGTLNEILETNLISLLLENGQKRIVRTDAANIGPKKIGKEITISTRPESVVIAPVGLQDGDNGQIGVNVFRGKITSLLFSGDHIEGNILLEDTVSCMLKLSRDQAWREGQEVCLTFPEKRLMLWPD